MALVTAFPNTQHVPISLQGVIFTLHQHLAVSLASLSLVFLCPRVLVLPGPVAQQVYSKR